MESTELQALLEQIKNITHTVEGYEVKDLVWKPVDNIIRGLVKCPASVSTKGQDGFVVATWRKNGTLTAKYGGTGRPDLYLKMT